MLNLIKNLAIYTFISEDQLNGCRFDGIAGAVQRMTEELLKELVLNGVKETGLTSVIFSGGVAQNIKAMKSLGELERVDSIRVLPAAGDTPLPIEPVTTLLGN